MKSILYFLLAAISLAACAQKKQFDESKKFDENKKLQMRLTDKEMSFPYSSERNPR